MELFTCFNFIYPVSKKTSSINFNKYLLTVFLAVVLFIPSESLFSQDNKSDLMYLNLIKEKRTDNQKKNTLPSDRNVSGFRIKSSAYENTLINQSGFKGYKTEKIQKLQSSNTKINYTDYDFSPKNTTPAFILTNTLGVMEYQAQGLLSLRTKDIPYIATVTGITLGLIALDAKLDKLVKNAMGRNESFDEVTDFITDFGAENSLYTVATFAGLSIITKSKKGLQTSLYAFEAMLNSGLWIRFGKLLAGRERPEASYEYSKHPSGIWRGPIHQLINKEKRSVASYDAFPSGHTATIFSVATVFAEQYKDIPIVPIISYSFATLVGITRMYEHAHWASDVFLGAVIGYLCGQSTINFYKQREHYNTKKVRFAVKPSITPTNYGADVVMNF